MKKLLYFSLLFFVLFSMPSGVAAQTATPAGILTEKGDNSRTSQNVRNTPLPPDNAKSESTQEDLVISSTNNVRSKDESSNKIPLLLSIVSLVIGAVAVLLVMKQKSDTQKQQQSDSQTNEALSKRVDTMTAEVGALKQSNEELRKQINQLVNVVNKSITAGQPSAAKNSTQTPTSSVKETHNVKQSAAKTKTFHTCYALAQEQGGRIMLYEGDDNCRTLFPFIIYHDGNQGEVSFNSESFAAVVSQLEVKLTPYADCQLKNTSAPSGINTVRKGSATKEGDYWVVINKPVLEIR